MTSVRVRVKETLRLDIYRQSVRLRAKPLETHDQRFFQLDSSNHSPYTYNTLLDEIMGLSLTNMLGLFKVYISHI
jgi:hypothetical protein